MKLSVSLLCLSSLCAGFTACGDQPPAQPQTAQADKPKPITEEEIGRPDLTPPEKKPCAILGFLCQ